MTVIYLRPRTGARREARTLTANQRVQREVASIDGLVGLVLDKDADALDREAATLEMAVAGYLDELRRTHDRDGALSTAERIGHLAFRAKVCRTAATEKRLGRFQSPVQQ